MEMRLTSKEQEKLVLDNQALVKYLVNKLGVSPSDFDDVVSIGTIGLIKAAITFDSSKTKFSIYASRCINNEIFMYFRMQKHHENNISIDNPIITDLDGELTIADTLIHPNSDVLKEITRFDDFARLVSIVLNVLSGKKRLIVLYYIADITQYEISKLLNFSQSYISRLEGRCFDKIKEYFTRNIPYEEVFKVSVNDNWYQISFSSDDIPEFNKIFASVLCNLSTQNLPNFMVKYDSNRVVLQFSADAESFVFIAKIVEQIDNFSIEYAQDGLSQSEVSSLVEVDKDKDFKVVPKATLDSAKSSDSQEPKSFASDDEAKEETNTSDEKISHPKSSSSVLNKDNKCKVIRDYFLQLEFFTPKELKQHFKDSNPQDINNAIHLAKVKGLITSVGYGKYKVNKN